MKERLGAFLLALVSAAGLSGCSVDKLPSSCGAVNTLDGIWIEIRPGSVTSTGLELVFQNTSDRDDFTYGCQFCLEEKHWGKWYLVDPGPANDGPSWDRHIYTRERAEAFPAGQVDWYGPVPGRSDGHGYGPNEMGYTWDRHYGELPEGDYRIVIELLSDRDSPIREDSPRYYLAAEFSVG